MNNAQLEVLKQGVNLLHRWCVGAVVDTAVSVDSSVVALAKGLCGLDIFAPDYVFPDCPLPSIFSSICIPPSPKKVPPALAVHPQSLNPQSFLDLGKSMEDQLRAFKNFAVHDIATHYSRIKDDAPALLVLLEKHGSFVPVAEKGPFRNISLYELVKFLAAGAMAGPPPKPYLLASADFSGIQEFIYTISSKGALKSLRSRSFFLEVLAQHTIFEILRGCAASPANVIYSGGGGFALLLPNSQICKDTLVRVKRVMNDWLLTQQQARLYLAMDCLELEEKDVRPPGFLNAWARMSKLLEQDKLTRFKNSMAQLLERSEPTLSASQECQICHRDDLPSGSMEQLPPSPGERPVPVCPLCRTLFQWGDDLTEYSYLVRGRGGSHTREIALPTMNGLASYSPSRVSPEADSYEVRWVKNCWDLSVFGDGRSFQLLHGDQAKKNGAVTADFEFLADASAGKKLLGAMRLDVDNLGLLLTRGLGPDGFDIPHYSIFSRQLNLFFALYVNLLCSGNVPNPIDIMGKLKANRGANLTIVYSGGDDLFVVGAWDEVTELACRLCQSFKEFTGHNDDVSISGGTVVVKPDFPLYQIANLSKRAEEAAKERHPDCELNQCSPNHQDCAFRMEKDTCARKDAALLFYVPARVSRQRRLARESPALAQRVATALPWNDILGSTRVVDVVKLFRVLSRSDIVDRMELQGLSRGFISRLFDLVTKWEHSGALYLPLMHYAVAKLKEGLAQGAEDSQKQKALQDLVGTVYLLNTDQIRTLWVALTWVDFLTREERGENAAVQEARGPG